MGIWASTSYKLHSYKKKRVYFEINAGFFCRYFLLPNNRRESFRINWLNSHRVGAFPIESFKINSPKSHCTFYRDWVYWEFLKIPLHLVGFYTLRIVLIFGHIVLITLLGLWKCNFKECMSFWQRYQWIITRKAIKKISPLIICIVSLPAF